MTNWPALLKAGGIFLVVFGCAMIFYLGMPYAAASFNSQFYDIYSDSPPPRHGMFQCPLVVRLGEEGKISVSVNHPADYRFQIKAPTFTVKESGSSWTITPHQVGNYYLSFSAYSYADLAGPIYHGVWQIYHTSFTDNCSVSVIFLPLPATQVLGLSVISMAIGVLLLIRARSQRLTARSH